MKVLVSTSTFGQYDDGPLKRLAKEGYEVEENPYRRKLSSEECLLHYRDKIGVIAGTEPITEGLLRNTVGLKVISRCGTGIDNVDIDAAKRLGIKVFNTPYGPTLAVAELTIGLIIGLLRRVAEMDADLRKGVWEKKMGHLLHGKKIGIVGYGKIGQKVGELLIPLGCQVCFTDVVVRSCPLGCRCVTLREVLKGCDIVSLHVSGQYKDSYLIGKEEIASMKKGAWLVNCARGGVVHEDALYEALEKKYLAGAAIDVFENEPYSGRLKTLSNVILTPHIGSYAKEARVAMEMQAVENLLKGLTGLIEGAPCDV